MSLEVTMAKIQIDGKFYKADTEKNLLETCLALGFNVPHFCYHPALGSVGACRLCAVKKFKDPDDKKGRIIMSCMEPVTEGLIISIEDEEAREFRAAVIEGLMTNHPHDCPVCDEGGECHLQDMTVMTGHNYRRFDFKKRTYRNQDLGPFVYHEMNRCIQCYRCVRFYRDYAGGKDLNAFASRNYVYFGRHEDGTLENEFSGNLVEVCPTGVFTDKTLKQHFTRKWDLTNSPSVCVHCSLGCNTIASERYDSLRRIMNRYNGAVNGYFICDRGRYGYEFVNDERRIRNVKISARKSGNLEEADSRKLASLLGKILPGNTKITGIGSPRASLESNYALSVLAGKENFYHGISKKEQQLTRTVYDFIQFSGVKTPSLKEIEEADAIIILGEDLVNTAPMMALAIRQAIRNRPNQEAIKRGIPLWNDSPVRILAQQVNSPVFLATPFKDSLDELAEESFRGSLPDIANLGSAIASAIQVDSAELKTRYEAYQYLAEKIALALKEAVNPLIISGTSCGDMDILHAALNIARALKSSGKNAMLSLVLPECNSMGLTFIPGKPLDELLARTENEEIDTLVVLENDLYRRALPEEIDRLFARSRHIIVIDQLVNNTSLHADLLLPTATFAESQGTLVNNEGRAQRYYRALELKNDVKESWQWIGDLIRIKDKTPANPWDKFDDVVSSLAIELPYISRLKEYIPDADFRMFNAKIPRQTIRYSGRTAIHANVRVSEAKLPEDTGSSLAFSMEGIPEDPPSSLVPFYWSPGWNSVQALYQYQDEPNGSMKGGDPGIRLIVSTGETLIPYFEIKSHTHKPQKDSWQIVPVHQVFGSGELSSAGPSIAQRTSEPFVYLNSGDAGKIGAGEGDHVHLEIGKSLLRIKIIIEDSLPVGIAGLSVNLPGMPFVDLPGTGKIYK